MNMSAPFVRRPVATTLLAVGLFLLGITAYFQLPVASLPAVDIPTIRIVASRPGADPGTMAASVAAPLERRLSEISGVIEMTSASSLGSTTITLQFDINRKIDNAARDVQAALNAAVTDLPTDLPALPTFRKTNPAAAPVLILALTSSTVPTSAIYDVADTLIAQRLSQVSGVAEVTVNGAEQPAIRARIDSARLAATGIGIDAVANAIIKNNTLSPVGSWDGETQAGTFATNDQLSTPDAYRKIIVPTPSGQMIRITDVATIERGVRNSRAAGWFNKKPAVLLVVTKQPDANVITTVDAVKAMIPHLQTLMPAGIDIDVLSDRTTTIRASIAEIQRTLMISILLVMGVVFLFLRRGPQTIAAGVTVPLSLAGTTAAMWAAGFSLDNLSLMAIIVSVGFVVDDAIVMIENVHRLMERGRPPLRAAIEGAGQIGFTVLSISLSLVAAFIPLIFMDGIAGRLFREFSLTLVFAIAVSTLLSLTVTPMICGQYMRADPPGRSSRFDRVVEGFLSALVNGYNRSLGHVLRHPWLTLIVIAVTVGLTVHMFRTMPKGYFPQDDTGLIFGSTEASPDISFPAMAVLQQKAAAIVQRDPDVASTASFIGSSGGSSVNQGRFFIALKPESVRSGASVQAINRMRRELGSLAGMTVYMFPVQDLRAGGRQSKAQYQYTLWDSSLAELADWAPKVLDRLKQVKELADVTSDRENGGLKAMVTIDRDAASRLGVAIADIDTALNDAFGQRQASIIYSQRNQYRVVVETLPERQRDPNDFTGLYVPAANGTQVPLSAVARIERGSMPLVVNHQGPVPAVTISFNLAPDRTLDAATQAIEEAIHGMNLPDGLRTEFAGDARDFQRTSSNQAWLILYALVAVYLILGILYESLIHPVTIISTLPSAGLGALMALQLFGAELTLIAFIGIILLIGIVKKNGIMLVDFAIVAERVRGLAPVEAAREAAVERFRPILMTTLAALFGALPLAIATGAGSELRRPLGITIVGGLILSQVLTLYTTPVIYLLMSRFTSRKAPEPMPAAAPAE
jgi:hydrophobe/amphiphile efflux-1 (HAE1) family protein